MPRYHFNLYNSIGLVEDEEGRELKNLEAARTEALKAVRAIIADEVSEGRVDLRGRVELVDEQGVLLSTIHFSEAVKTILDGEASDGIRPNLD